jgi:ornithine cyclodeaminase/alanine dehydrogenase-like protein (mu-crystallin family)
MKIITHNQITSLGITPETCVDWVKEAFLQKHECYLPAKISLKLSNNIFFNTMPCIIPSLDAFGVKVVSRYPNEIPSLKSQILLYSTVDGSIEAIIDGNWITAMRTGAVAALAAKTFAKPNASSIAFIGLGNTARATMLCLASVFSDRTLRIKLRSYKNQAELFIERFNSFTNISFVICNNNEDVLKQSDIIISCVTAANELIGENSWFDPGVLVIPVHTRGFQNCDLFFDKVFGDDTDHIRDFKNFKKFKCFSEFSEVLLNKKVGRGNELERIICYNIGISLHDIFFSKMILNLISSVDKENLFNSPIDKFWV